MKKTHRIELERSHGGRGRWYTKIVCCANGAILWTSQMYKRKSNALNTAFSFRRAMDARSRLWVYERQADGSLRYIPHQFHR